MENVKVTVWLSTYNQAPYVAQALDSIMMQKTTFPFEVIAADDCSTDGTQEVILQYQKQYPDQIIPYFTNPNVGGCRKLCDCIDKGLFRGEYISFLEGDDYWLGEDRLQTLVGFLENHPEYSRVSHRRRVIDESSNDIGYDIPEEMLNKPFYIDDFLSGHSYSDFGSLFRNYFKTVGSKYHPLLLASRNVCDFQDMFITQDFGPVFVLDRVYGAYRSRSIAGATNYNSITTVVQRARENIHLAQTVESFFHGRYDLSPMIKHHKKRIFEEAVKTQNPALFDEIREMTSAGLFLTFIAEQIYLSKRGCRKKEVSFLKEQLHLSEKALLPIHALLFRVKRVIWKKCHYRPNEQLRGYVRKRKKGAAI